MHNIETNQLAIKIHDNEPLYLYQDQFPLERKQPHMPTCIHSSARCAREEEKNIKREKHKEVHEIFFAGP